ncbi:hypothetical protein [Nocardia sp. NPDC019395]|uniref:hypothetical protein n=1 Tax=Nocardia sp. NPDC019395 TaxID=3154686 RepID=UPI0033E7E54F
MNNTTHHAVRALRTGLWQLTDNPHPDTLDGVHSTEVVHMADAHLHTGEGRMRTLRADVHIRCALTYAHPAVSSAQGAQSAHAPCAVRTAEPAPGAHGDLCAANAIGGVRTGPVTVGRELRIRI